MIVMINGAFGVGKTTVAEALLNEIDKSMIFDPEVIGYMLRHMMPKDIQLQESNTGDFQDLQLWPELTVETAARLISRYQTNLIVPMTIRKPDNFQYIYNGLKKWDENIHAFCLTASKDTIHQRLFHRGEQEGAWCFHQTDACLEAFEQYDLGTSLSTENISVSDIVETITNQVNDKANNRRI